MSARRTKVSRLCSKTDPLLVYEGNLFLDVDWRKHQPSSSTKEIIPRNLTFAPHNPVQEVENSLKIMDSSHIYISVFLPLAHPLRVKLSPSPSHFYSYFHSYFDCYLLSSPLSFLCRLSSYSFFILSSCSF